MNARRFSMSRHSTLAVAGGAVVVCVLGAMGTLASCSDPTASMSTFAEPVQGEQGPGASSEGGSTDTKCPPGTAPTPGPKPGVTYCENPNNAAFNEDCMPGDWIPGPMEPPPPVRMFSPPPHPDTECPFYRGAYQNFMIATTPIDSAGDPAIINYPTIDDAFDFTIPHKERNTGIPYSDSAYPGLDAGPTGRAWLGAVRQAGQRNILVDQNDHTLYYGLHMNQAFYDFIKDNNLRSVNAILNVDPKLSFPPGLVEFKTAWEDIDPQDFPNGVVPPPPEGDFACSGGNPTYMIPAGMGVIPPLPSADGGANSACTPPSWDVNYITTMAWLPHLYKDSSGIITEDPDHPRLRKVALVAIHSVYTLPGHAEFIWGSIQHVNLNAYDPGPVTFASVNIQGAPDSQPYGTGPDGGPPTFPTMATGLQNQNVGVAPSTHDYLFYKGGTPENQALALIPSNQLPFDEASQSFPDGGALETVYRMFPGSKSTHLEPDTAVFSLNSNLNYLYANAIKAGNVNPLVDKRLNYRLVAAVWLDKPYFFGTTYPGLPADTSTFPQGAGESLQNDDGTNPLVVAACGTGASCLPPPGGANYYLNVSQGDFCGTPLDSTNTSGDSPSANGTNNTVPGCSTRLDDIAWGDDPLQLYDTGFTAGAGPFDQTGGDPFIPGGVPPIFASGTDYEFSLLGGEDRLSSTAMETFTQNNTFHNCFACHNTRPIDTNGVFFDPNSPGGAVPLLPRPANINVSHLFSEFILRDAEEVCGASTIPCPGQLPPTTASTATATSTTTTTAGH